MCVCAHVLPHQAADGDGRGEESVLDVFAFAKELQEVPALHAIVEPQTRQVNVAILRTRGGGYAYMGIPR